MARFEVQGLEEIIEQMRQMGQMSGAVAEAMLMAGAEQVRQAWRASAESHGHRDTGQMIASIGYPRQPTNAGDVMSIDIYPQGTNTNGVRNAEVAFVLHYGTRKRPGTRWIDEADERAGPMVQAAMEGIWSRYVETGTVPVVVVPNWHAERRAAGAAGRARHGARKRFRD